MRSARSPAARSRTARLTGIELGEIMQAGRWDSPRMGARYTEHLAAAWGEVARYRGARS